MAVVLVREPSRQAVPMLEEPLFQIVCDTHVKRAVRAGQDVDPELTHNPRLSRAVPIAIEPLSDGILRFAQDDGLLTAF